MSGFLVPRYRLRIPGRVLKTLLLRGTILWLLARLMAAAILGAAADASSRGGKALPAWTLAMSATLLLVDLHRRKELMLLNNLGVFTWHAILVGSIPALVLEASLLIILR